MGWNGMDFAEKVVTGGVGIALVVNLAAPFTVTKPEPTGYGSCTVEVVHAIRAHHFDVGSLSASVQWAQVDGMRLPAT